MQNFNVSKNDFSFKATTHKFKLILCAATFVNAAYLPDIPLNHFRLTSLTNMLVGKFQPEFLTGSLTVDICCFISVII